MPALPADRFVQPVREAIRHECKLTLAYQDEHGSATARTVWPFALAYFEGKRLLAAWCELRGDYRHFRIDRIASVDSWRTLSEAAPRAARRVAQNVRYRAGKLGCTPDKNCQCRLLPWWLLH